MTAARKALDSLAKALSKATPPMWYPVGRMTEEESLQVGGVDPHITSDNGTTVADYISERNAECASLSVNLSAPLAAVARAAMEWRDMADSLDAGFTTEKADKLIDSEDALRAALDALEAAAKAQGFHP